MSKALNANELLSQDQQALQKGKKKDSLIVPECLNLYPQSKNTNDKETPSTQIAMPYDESSKNMLTENSRPILKMGSHLTTTEVISPPL